MASAEELHPLERKVLPALAGHHAFEKIVEQTGLQDIEVMRALQWLQNKSLVRIDESSREIVSLDRNGLTYKEKGLPEKRFLAALTEEKTASQIMKDALLSEDEIKVCIGLLRSKAAISLVKDGELKISMTDNGKRLLAKGFPEEKILCHDFPLDPSRLSNEDSQTLSELLRRRQIIRKETIKKKSAFLTDTGKAMLKHDLDEELVEKLSAQLIKTGGWKGKKFRRYDVQTNVPQISGGRRHFVDQSISYIKRIWLDLGFQEMEGNLVQTSFWDLDSLFVPQDHPARDMQDTFYIKEPKSGRLPDKWKEQIKAVHENGWTTGSRGWGYKWSEDMARENLLRTHTTVLSAQTISRLKAENLPAKFFSVNRVFRNEALNWKHLFEFVQVEGIVVDRDANFTNLKGYLKQFFNKMGFPDVRIRPGHFPYTEPSAEVDVWHPVRKEWVELGGSGIFRPEVVKPLLGEEVPVLAWGLGMERTIMEYYGISDVRDLYRNDLKQLREIRLWNR